MRVDFYHLAGISAEAVVPQLARKVLEAGEKLLVVGGPQLLGLLDVTLWTADPASFLPHGRAGHEGEGMQPILLSETADAANGARYAMLADGHWREEALGFDRVFYLFGSETIDEARSAWRSLSAAEGVEPHYWKREGDRWVEGP